MKIKLILLSLLVMVFYVSGQTCEGVATSCNSFSTEATCNQQQGCSWTPVNKCTGNLDWRGDNCNDFRRYQCCGSPSVNDCVANNCKFGGGDCCESGDSNLCTGKQLTYCANRNTEGFCNVGWGCSWSTSYQCGGTAQQCSLFTSESSCTQQADCNWVSGCEAGVGEICCDEVLYEGNCCDNSDCAANEECQNHQCVYVGSVCGNGVIDSGELCDSSNVGDETCQSQGYSEGTLMCNSECDGYIYSFCGLSDVLYMYIPKNIPGKENVFARTIRHFLIDPKGDVVGEVEFNFRIW